MLPNILDQPTNRVEGSIGTRAVFRVLTPFCLVTPSCLSLLLLSLLFLHAVFADRSLSLHLSHSKTLTGDGLVVVVVVVVVGWLAE